MSELETAERAIGLIGTVWEAWKRWRKRRQLARDIRAASDLKRISDLANAMRREDRAAERARSLLGPGKQP